MRRLLIFAAAALALLLLAPWKTARPRAQQTRAERATPGNILVNVRFGLNDRASADWSGSVEVAGGRLEKIEGWHFAQGPNVPTSRITGANTWTANSLPSQPPALHVDLSPVLPGPRPVWPLGLLLFLSGDERTRVTLRFAKQPPGALRSGGPEPVTFAIGGIGDTQTLLGGAVEAERLPRLHRVGGEQGEADHPSVAVAADGATWVAWQEYRGGSERVLARRFAGGAWSEPHVVADGGDFFKTAIAQSGDSRLWVVWSARENAGGRPERNAPGGWHLWGRSFDGARWSAPEKLSTSAGPNFHHKLVADRSGRLWLVWQGFAAGQSDIFLRIYEAGIWKPAERVSTGSANDWEPSVAVDADGRGWIVWDAYTRSYNVFARSFHNGSFSAILPVAAGPRFEAHASVAIDQRGRPWIAYDESGENWGKDWGFLVKDRGIGLYMGRSLQLVVLESGRVMKPDVDLRAAIPEPMQMNPSLPSLHADGQGRIWLVFRYLAGARTRVTDGWAANGGWENAALVLAGGMRSYPLARSLGRNDGRAAAAAYSERTLRVAGRDGLAVAYATDHRPFLSGNAQDYGVYLSEVPAATAPSTSEATLKAAEPSAQLATAAGLPPAQLPPHSREADDVRRLREYRAKAGGRSFRIARGDLHRHTDISGDGVGDGSLLDLYRYALDAAAMDFIAVTDHGAGADQEYSWWRTQKSCDLFLAPGAFTPLYGYERSLPYPNGHRNIVFARRGVRTLPSSPEERQGKEGAAKLYRYLRETGGIAFSHTIATDQGTDWRDNDPALEPLVEIYQGFRNSYEHEGAPKSAMAGRPYLFKSGYRPPGFYWNALAKGYKLGIQASSDHISTHLSYTCLYTTGLSREELMEAMRERRAYGATDNILLDFRLVEPNGAEHLMGAIVGVPAPPRLKVRAVGTAPIRRVDIIKNGRYIYTSEPAGSEAAITFSDPEKSPGESWYYVRVLQHDGQIAWSSPIWVTQK